MKKIAQPTEQTSTLPPDVQRAFVVIVVFILIIGSAHIAQQHGIHIDTEVFHKALPSE